MNRSAASTSGRSRATPRRLSRPTIVRKAYEVGVFITPVIAPAVPEKDVLIRFALMATHSIEQVDEAVEKLTKIFRELGVIE